MPKSTIHRYFAGLSRNTLLLAFASLFADISTEMLYPVLPVFLTQTLKATGAIGGLVGAHSDIPFQATVCLYSQLIILRRDRQQPQQRTWPRRSTTAQYELIPRRSNSVLELGYR